VGLHADGLDADVGTAPAAALAQLAVDVVALILVARPGSQRSTAETSPTPGRLDQVLAGDPMVAPEAHGQAIGQSQMGEDDPLADGRVAGGLTVQEPPLDLADRLLVARADVENPGDRPCTEPDSQHTGSNPSSS
jgi:hypothetical protein